MLQNLPIMLFKFIAHFYASQIMLTILADYGKN